MSPDLHLRSPGAAHAMVAWAALLALAGAALALGLLVYLFDRPAGSAWLLPAGWHMPGAAATFGGAGAWLPSFVHAFAFSVLTAWLLPRRVRHAALACLAWAIVDTLAECGQHAAVAPLVAAALAALFGDSATASQVGRYFTHGSFAAADIAAGLAGAAVAFVALRWVIRAAAARRASPPVEPSTR